ncbi:GTPase-activating protein skywalker-like isoform X2 [Ruditapes philippinarum]|uniref:GTPase-activating protein skywalker-like isoform X2 n=1 Tax=Ruditapes philippinarum TaxID=129788 RepID=UPI00295A82FB|nr:GTPase-activating protein skywalker-like isoform X2 [Ruditapes philippinarum]
MNSLNCVSSKSTKKKKSSLETRNEKKEAFNMADKPDSESPSPSVNRSDSLIEETHVTDAETGHTGSIGKHIEQIENIDDSQSEHDISGSEEKTQKSCAKDITEVEISGDTIENKEKSEINLEELGFVEVNESDVVDMASVNAGKVKFDMEVEDETVEVFSEFVDMRSVIGDIKVKHSVEEVVEISAELLLQYLKRHQKKQYKAVLRNGSWDIKHNIRHSLWFNICHYLHKADDHDIFSEFAEDLFSPGDASDIRVPAFVDVDHLNYYHLSQDGIHSAKQILCVLEHSCPDIIYSPILFSVLSLFLHYMDVSQCYNCLYSLLRNKESGFLPTTKVSVEASKLVIRDLAKKYAKSGYVLVVRNCGNVDQVFDTWIWWIFEDLPFSYLVRIMDCYLNEGIKVFYRVALAILTLFAKTNIKKSPKKDNSTGNILSALRQFCREVPVGVDKLLKTGFSIRGLGRKEIRKLQVKHEMYVTSTKHVNNFNEGQASRLSITRSFSGPIVLQNLGTDTLTVDMLYAILKWIPTRYAICQPELLYTSEEHGTSLVTLYQRVENYQPTIIVIKTTQDEVFGAFCSACWRDRRQKSQLLSYFGTGETFLFTLWPEKKKYEWVGLKEENISNTASMFQAGDRKILTVGGGHGNAISLDENLLHCRTEKCDTFDNEPLSKCEDFQCKVVEVYGFV